MMVIGGTLRGSDARKGEMECQGKQVMLAALVVPDRPLGRCQPAENRSMRRWP